MTEGEKIILLFLDLEGTILRESDWKYSSKDMYDFLSQIKRLQELTNRKVNMHLVSPIYASKMKQFMARINDNICKFNESYHFNDYIPEIKNAGACPDLDTIEEDEHFKDNIIFFKKPINSRDFHIAEYGKELYVHAWYETYKKNLIMAIYCGDSGNDLRAINYIRSLKNGFIICPKNSKDEIKKRAHFIGNKTDLPGITEGLRCLGDNIKRNNQNKSVEKIHIDNDFQDRDER